MLQLLRFLLLNVYSQVSYGFFTSLLCDCYQVPERFKHLYERHKVMFAAQVDATLKNLATNLKRMQSQCLACMLIDVDASIRGGDDGPSIVLSSGAAPDSQNNMVNDLGSQNNIVLEDAVQTEAEPDVDATKDQELHGCAAKEGEGNIDTGGDVEVLAEPQPVVLLDSSCVASAGGDQVAANSPEKSAPVLAQQQKRTADF